MVHTGPSLEHSSVRNVSSVEKPMEERGQRRTEPVGLREGD